MGLADSENLTGRYFPLSDTMMIRHIHRMEGPNALWLLYGGIASNQVIARSEFEVHNQIYKK